MTNRESTASAKTLAALGFSMPAEWSPHEATWLGWPHNRTDWPGKIVPIHWVHAEIVRKLAPGEIVRILVKFGRAREKRSPHALERRSRSGARSVPSHSHQPRNG